MKSWTFLKLKTPHTWSKWDRPSSHILICSLPFIDFFLSGPEQVLTCEVPIVFWMTTFSSQIIAFFTAWTYPKTHQTWNIPVEKWHNLLSSSISITMWHCYQEKCVLAYNSHILCRTFKNLTSTQLCWISWYSSDNILQIRKMLSTYFSNSLQVISPICTKL